MSSDFHEQAVELEDYDVVDALEESEIRELEIIENAMD